MNDNPRGIQLLDPKDVQLQEIHLIPVEQAVDLHAVLDLPAAYTALLAKKNAYKAMLSKVTDEFEAIYINTRGLSGVSGRMNNRRRSVLEGAKNFLKQVEEQ